MAHSKFSVIKTSNLANLFGKPRWVVTEGTFMVYGPFNTKKQAKTFRKFLERNPDFMAYDADEWQRAQIENADINHPEVALSYHLNEEVAETEKALMNQHFMWGNLSDD